METLDENVESVAADEEDGRERGTIEISFSIDHVSSRKDPYLSPPFYVRNLPWKLFVTSSLESDENKTLAIFVQCNNESDSQNWSCSALVKIKLKSSKLEDNRFEKSLKRVFNSKEFDWGFLRFVTWKDLLNPENGLLENDTLTVQISVDADAPHGVMWNSKKYTGYVGLKNQGATCYMNSLLQTLFFTNAFRKAVYKMPTECDDHKSVPLALQGIFYDLQYSNKPVGTKRLTLSFGWDLLDSFMQHDVQEFLRVLLDALEDQMCRTNLKGTIPSLFAGKMMSYIKCKHVNMTSKVVERFYDIQLNIKGCKNIYESFQHYITAESLEGENKYDAGEYGFQEAEKGVSFLTLPPVLHLHLMRFQYDPITDNTVKFNDKFEFFDEVNLSSYLENSTGSSEIYKLHAVLVHSGDNAGGHYIVYIDPKADGKWCKFDDDVVSKCTEFDAINQNFGGINEENVPTAKQNSSAYMLVYIRQTDIPRVLQDIKMNDIPIELLAKLEEVKRTKQVKKTYLECSQNQSLVNVNVFLEEDMQYNEGLNLINPNQTKFREFKFKKTDPLKDVLRTISVSFNYSENKMRIWSIERNFDALRPMYIHTESSLEQPFLNFKNDENNCLMFLQLANIEEGLPLLPFDKRTDVLIFYKYYDPREKELYYLFSSQYPGQTTLIDVVDEVRHYMGHTPKKDYTIYMERNGNDLRKILNLNETFDKYIRFLNRRYNDGIFIFEPKLPDEVGLVNCEQFIQDLLYAVAVTFFEKNKPKDNGFTINISQNTTLKDMAVMVGKKINFDPHKLKFYKTIRTSMGNSYKYSSLSDMKQILLTRKQKMSGEVYYEKLNVHLSEVWDKLAIMCTLVSLNMKDEEQCTLYVNQTDTIHDLLNEAKKVYKFSEKSSYKLRFLEIVDHKIYSIRNADTVIEDLQKDYNAFILNDAKPRYFRIEEVPIDDLGIEDSFILVPVCHFDKENSSYFGVPFLLKINKNEGFVEFKQRIQRKLKISDKEWEKFKIAGVSKSKEMYISEENFIDVMNHITEGNEWPHLVLEHTEKPLRRVSSSQEKPIKIFN